MDIKALIKDPKAYLIAVVLVFAGEKVGSYLQKGVEADLNKTIESGVVSSLKKEEVINKLMANPRFVEMILAHPKVAEYTDKVGMELRDGIIEDVTKKDSSKINQNAFLGKELGIRDEAVTPLLRDLLRDYKEGKLATKDDIRPRRNPNTWVDPMNVNGN